jgi:GT2 family glycosyltransferase
MKVTIVIPCRNENPFIRECIDAIYACDLPSGVEISVFIVDGLSDDGTLDTIKELQQEHENLHLVVNEKQLTPYAFNLGIYAGGKVDFIQIVGARHILSSNYLAKSIEIITRDPSIWCVGGAIKNEFLNETSQSIAKAMSTTFGMGLGNFRTLDKSGFTDTVTSPMYPYSVFEKIGFFDEELIRNQDDDFNYRVAKHGGKIFFEASIHLKYYVRGNYKGLWRQFYQYGYWKVFVNKKHGAVTTYRQLIPPLFVIFAVGSIPLLFVNQLFSILGLSIWLLYILMALFFGLKVTKTNITLFPKVLITFPLLHFSYGLGYLNGILQFVVLKKKPSDSAKQLSR